MLYSSDSIELQSIGKGPAFISSEWLYDNREEAMNPLTFQRESDRHGETKEYIVPQIESAALEDDVVTVQFGAPLSGIAKYSAKKLIANVDAPPFRTLGVETANVPSSECHMNPANAGKRHWDASSFSNALNHVEGDGNTVDLPTAQYADIVSDKGCSEWLENIDKYGFCLLQGCPVDNSEDSNTEFIAAQTANYVRNSVFDGVWRFEDNYEHADTAYNNNSLPLHTDGTYSHDPPGLQMLHCVKYEATGGVSILSDGFKVLSVFKEECPESFELLLKTQMSFSYHDTERAVLLRNVTAPVVVDEYGDVKQLRFNDCDRDPFPYSASPALYRAWHNLSEIVKRKQNCVQFQLTPGNTLVFDNWRLMHARTAFNGKRKIVGCYMNKEDFSSRLRAVRAANA